MGLPNREQPLDHPREAREGQVGMRERKRKRKREPEGRGEIMKKKNKNKTIYRRQRDWDDS